MGRAIGEFPVRRAIVECIKADEIRPIFENIRVLGVAFTVLNYPDDNITTHKALTMLEPGDVLVIDEGRESNTGAFGHKMSLQARNRGPRRNLCSRSPP